MKSRFLHHCVNCVFIAQVGDYDIYECGRLVMSHHCAGPPYWNHATWSSDGGERLLARYGDHSAAFVSLSRKKLTDKDGVPSRLHPATAALLMIADPLAAALAEAFS